LEINMDRFSKTLQLGAATLVMVAVLSACGGGGGGGASNTPTPTPTPTPSPTAPVPTAVADVATVGLNQSATLAVLQNDTVTNGGTLALIGAGTPAHGTATVSGSNIVYTPAPGYFGSDAFTYTMGAGLATTTGQVAVTVAANLTLAGKVVDVPANASVTVTVGTKVTTTTTDASGNFSAPVALDTPASMISISAQGTGAQAFVKLISLAGDSQLAVNAAAGATTLTPAMLPGLKVSALSTALHAHATRKNGGVVPATQLALDAASANVGASEMLQMAAVIRSITGSPGVAPRRALPAGVADVQALVNNPALYVPYVKLIAQEALFTEIGAIYSDTAQTSVPSIAVGTTQTLNLYGNESCCANAATEVVLNPDGSGSLLKDQQRLAVTWTRDANALTLTLVTPVVRTELADAGTVPPSQVQVQTRTTRFILRQATGSADHGFVTLTQAGTIHYPGGQREDGNFSSSSLLAFSEWARLTAATDVGGSTLGGIPDTINAQAVGQRQLILALAADGSASSAQLPGVATTWQAQSGKLVVNFGAGRVQTMVRLAVAANGEERWLGRASAGADYALYEFAVVRVQPGLAFTDASAVNRWLSRPVLSEISISLFVNLLASHAGIDEALELDGTVVPFRTTSWSVDGGALVITSYSLPDGSAAASCPAGVTCTIRTQRSWTLLRSDAAGVFVFEMVRFSDADIRYRVNRYDRTL
jgi:hypothetical protein